MIGRTIGRYRVVAKLGQGGMGSVWRAEDTLLERTIALKFLPESLASSEEARHRFLREARAASVLDHPGIATVYDTGEADGQVYIAMRHVEGRTLADRLAAGPVPIDEAIQIAIEAAEALGHAHARGVLHRDVKSSNIMLTPEGHAVVVDFGLAVAEGQTRLTSTGAAMGTAAYMAPEVIQGKEATAATDQYGLGVVLYELVAGILPFRGARHEAQLYAAVHTRAEPPSSHRPSAPRELDRIVLKALEKDPAQRFRDAASFARALRALAARGSTTVVAADDETMPFETQPEPAVTPQPEPPPRRFENRRRRILLGISAGAAIVAALGIWRRDDLLHRLSSDGFSSVAVLPFRTAGEDPAAIEYLAAGLGEVLSQKLTQVSDLRVTPWVTAQRFADLSRPLLDIAGELQVNALLIGTVRLSGDRVQGTLALVDGESGLQVWADDFDEPMTQLFEVQKRIAVGAASRLRREIAASDREMLERPVGRNVEAYQLYLQGAQALRDSSGDDTQALSLFERAVRLDSDLAEAHVGIGAVNSARHYRGGTGGERSLVTARENFEKALGLEPDLLAARRGLVRCFWQEGKSEDVLKQGSEAARRGRGDVDELVTRGEAYILGGLADKAIPLLRRALDLDPANEGALWFLVIACAWAGQYADCIQSGETFLTRFGEDPEILTWLGAAHLCRDEFDAAESRYLRAVALFGEDSNLFVYFQLGNLYRRRGDAAKARETWQRGLDECTRKLDAYPDNSRTRCILIGFLGLLGERKRVEEEEQRIPPRVGDLALAVVGYAEAMLGNRDRAVEWMRRGLQNGSYNIVQETVWRCAYGASDHVADTPGYKDFLQEYTREGGRLRAIY